MSYTPEIPNQISHGELQKFLANAESEVRPPSTNTVVNDLTQEDIERIAAALLDKAVEDCPDPIIHKIMALGILSNLHTWHEAMAKRALEAGDAECAGITMEDAGALRSAYKLLVDVSLGETDFTISE